MKNQRRQFIKNCLLGAAVLSAKAPVFAGQAAAKILIIGGGSGGTTLAKYLKIIKPELDITLVEPKAVYTTCYMSNEVFSEQRTLKSLQFNYSALQRRGIKIIQDKVININPLKKQAQTQQGQTLNYDRCILAIGIDFKWDQIEGYNAQIAEQIPHAWQAGKQTQLLYQQIKAMKKGGTVAIAVPPKPYRCGPAPYERATHIAHYLKRHNPTAKIMIFDYNTRISMGAHFKHLWQRDFAYGKENALIEWFSGEDESGIVALDVKQKAITTAFDDRFKADVINLIPPQKAGALATQLGLTDETGWCPVNLRTLVSKKYPNLHIIGDAIQGGELPKTAYAANSQAKVCAFAIKALLENKPIDAPSYMNSCYAIMADDYAVSSVAIYKLLKDESALHRVSGGLTPLNSPAYIFQREVAFARNWYRNITTDIFN